MKLKVLTGLSALVVAMWLVGSYTIVRGQPEGGSNAHRAPQSVAEFEKWQKDVSNWGRWGKDDELGTYNLLTDAKRKDAAKLIKNGHQISLTHNLITEKAPDTPNEPGDSLGPFLMTNGGTTYKISFHSTTHSHIDALCQFDYQGLLYNGFNIKEVKSQKGCTKEGMELEKAGFNTRGILMDIPRLKGLPYLEPGTPVYPEDFEAWEKKTGVKVQPGDAVFLRTGRWTRRVKVGPWNLIPNDNGAGEAGYHVLTVPWMRKRDVAVVAADVLDDVRPSGVSQEVLSRVRSMPVHSLVIVSMGGYIIDAVDLEELADYCAKTNRYEFMVVGAAMAAVGGTGSTISLTALF